MSNNIFIRNISSLTDARYFAAMGVDWMSVKLSEDPASFSKWHTMREWVAGVKLAVELISNDESLIAKAMIDAFGTTRYIANLGHGILPNVPVDHARAFVDTVKSYKQ